MSDNTETREELDAKLDEQLLKILTDGVTVALKECTVTITAPHQYFEVARKRLSDLNLSKEPGENSDAARFAKLLDKDPEALKTHGMPKFIAEVSGEPDAATTATPATAATA